ncbi:D-aminoacyl-tRNA deacylase [Lutibacter citreus]|uniref:D-aminoacyl-tRNA deacylase n=1 Tax=Lutibacter citreus TaxID=2138210 RepID=UPI000DBE5411|nr:D-aminoacyl-tRNA deacylase [Lutibacter citreus]
MKVVIQRVSEASVTIDNIVVSKINDGLLILVGIVSDDTKTDIDWLAKKVANLRVFNDENEVMNKSLRDVDGEAIIVSQFTLQASTKKGNRPSYINAAKPDVAIPLYNQLVNQFEIEFGKKVGTGEFGADMKVSLINDGPVTIIIDTKHRV